MTRINELLGKVNRLYISKRTVNGVYLSPLGESDVQILLPKNQVPSGSEKGDILEAFIYKDSEDRPELQSLPQARCNSWMRSRECACR